MRRGGAHCWELGGQAGRSTGRKTSRRHHTCLSRASARSVTMPSILEVNCAPHCCLSRVRMERSWSSDADLSCRRSQTHAPAGEGVCLYCVRHASSTQIKCVIHPDQVLLSSLLLLLAKLPANSLLRGAIKGGLHTAGCPLACLQGNTTPSPRLLPPPHKSSAQ